MSALKSANVAAFVLTAGDLTGQEMAAAFVKALPRIRKLLRDREVPLVGGVKSSGEVELLTASARRASKRRS